MGDSEAVLCGHLMAVGVGTTLTTSSGWGKTRLGVRSLQVEGVSRWRWHCSYLAQRAGVAVAQSLVRRPDWGDQAGQEPGAGPGVAHLK